MAFFNIQGYGLTQRGCCLKIESIVGFAPLSDTMNIPLPSGYTTWQCNPSQAAFTKRTHTHTPQQQWAPFSMTAIDEWRAEKPFFFFPLQVAGIQDEHHADRRRREQLRCSTIHTTWQDSVSRYCALNSLIFASQHGYEPKECVIHIHLFTFSELHWESLYIWQRGQTLTKSGKRTQMLW